MNLSKKLFVATLTPMLFLLLSGGFTTLQTIKIFKEFAAITDTYDANANMALQMQVDFKSQIQQWKDLLLRGDNPDDRALHWAEFQRLEKKIDIDGFALVVKLENSKATPLIQDFLVMHKRLGVAYRNSLDIFLKSNYNIHQADNTIRGIDKAQSENLKIAVDRILEEDEIYSRKAIEDAWYTVLFNALLMIATLIITSYFFFEALKQKVISPIGLLSRFAKKFGDGDYSQRIDFKSDDEFGVLTDTFNHASKQIESLVTNLETSEMRYRNLIQEIDAIIWEFDPNTNKFKFISKRAEELLGYPQENWLNQTGFLATYCHPDDLAACMDKTREILQGGASGEYTHRAITAGGTIVWLNNRIKMITDAQSLEKSLLGVTVDITRMKQYEDRMAYQSTHDELTGLANRNLLTDRLERAIAHASSADNITALMLVNIDRFKLINESLGHKVGDDVIKSVAQRLQKFIGTDDTLAHLGGDEFAIVLRDIKKPEDAAEIAMDVLEQISQPLEIAENLLIVNCSIGISIYPKDGHNSSDMLKNAGSALTRVKQQEKNNFRFYTEEMNATALSFLQLENKMRRAIENREFVLFYQPQINIIENRMIGVEALIRWFPPGEAMISPLSFIPLAEETKLILPIGEWVIWEACRQNKAWQDKGFAPFCVAVNLSAIQFGHPDIIGLVTRALDETGLDPQYLELEITESVMMNDVELVIKNLETLHNLGIKLAIDDFGTGYSSLSYLQRLPIDKLKVDKSFVQDISIDSADEAIVATIITMAHNLKMSVIAEGVETEIQLQYLRDRKCEEVQGYYFSKPLAADLLENYMSDKGLAHN